MRIIDASHTGLLHRQESLSARGGMIRKIKGSTPGTRVRPVGQEMKMETYYDVADIANLIKMAVAPVFLLTGIGSFLNVLSSRLARIVDRARKLEEFIATQFKTEESLAELRFQVRRLRLVGWSIGLCVSSALLICALVALLFLGGLLHFDPSEALGFLFALAMIVLILALVLFLGEIQMSIRYTQVGGIIKSAALKSSLDDQD